MVIVATSYYQTIHGYPSGGGAYIVAYDNLGVWPGLIAAAALLTDYVLTAAVSVTSGVAAVTSVNLGSRPVENQMITCSNCGAQLEVLSLHPLEIDWAFLDPVVGDEEWDRDWEEEWDEDWEKEEAAL